MTVKRVCPFPVGGIYLATDSTNPATIWPNTTWQAIQNCMLMAAGSAYGLGTSGGSATHTLTTDELPSHKHSVGAHKHTVPAHGHAHTITATTPQFTHSITQPVFTYTPPAAHTHGLSNAGGALFDVQRGNGSSATAVFHHTPDGPTVATTAHTAHQWLTGSSGGWDKNSATERSTATARLCGKTDSAACSGTANSATASRTTNVAVGAHAASACTMSGSVTDKAAFDTNDSTAFDSGATGGGKAFSTLPPYMAVCMWKRVA